MPELPEVHALVTGLGGRMIGRSLERVDVVAFAALKTFDPPVSALAGRQVAAVTRHGKFLDFTIGDLHLVVHLARAGWIRWRDGPPPPPSGRPGKGPLAARVVLAASSDGELPGGPGLDITEAGTKKSLAIYVVTDPAHVPGIARLGPDPLDDSFTYQKFSEILGGAGRAQIKGVLRNQSIIAGSGNAYSDEILHAAQMSPFKPAAMNSDEASRLFDAMRSTLREAVARADGLEATELKREKKTNMRVQDRKSVV